MAQSDSISSLILGFLRSHEERLLLIEEVPIPQEDVGLASFSCVLRGIRRSYRLFISVERREPGCEIEFLAELLRPEALSEQIDEKGTEFFSTMVRRLNEPYPGEPFAFDAGHPSLLCSALADGLSEDAITEDLLNGLFAAIRYLVRHYEKHLDTLLLEMTSNPYPEGFKCKQCGHCCMNLEAHYMSVPQADVDRWREAGRYDILEWVVSIPIGDDEFIHDIWISPTTGEDVRRCPWLRKLPKQDKYVCRIQDLKPTVCRIFPQSRKHARECGCPGFDEP